MVSYETIRRWGRKFGPDYTGCLRRKQADRNDIWYLDEVAITIAGKKHWLWRAVDQDGHALAGDHDDLCGSYAADWLSEFR
jgi:putative transposase